MSHDDSFGYFGLDSDCTHEELLKVYRERALVAHPDKGGDMAIFKQVQANYDTARKKLDGVVDDPFSNLTKAFDALYECSKSEGESRDLTDPEMWNRYPYVCNNCGHIAATYVGIDGYGINIIRSLSDWHYYASPECWEMNQARLKARFEDNQIGDYGHCLDCRRVIYTVSRGKSRKCPYCVMAKIRRNRKRTVQPRACPTCGDTFQPKRSDARFCCSACRQKTYRKRVTANSQAHSVPGNET